MTISVTTGGPISDSSDPSAAGKDYAWLKNAVTNWMARTDLSGEASDFILLAEAALNRELGPVEIDTALTGEIGSRQIDISALAMVRPVALFMNDATTSDEIELTPKSDGTFPYRASNGCPRLWTVDTVFGSDTIELDCPLDTAYSFRFRYWEKFALSEDATTNWLLTNHPDIYLAAVLIWGGMFTRDSDFYGSYSSVLEAGIPSVKHNIAQRKRAVATVDPALQPRRLYSYNGVLA
jgi:hypothetical protein